MLKDFKKFILRGNVVDLGVAVVIGGAFNSVVQSLVRDFIQPLIQGVSGQTDNLKQGKVTVAFSPHHIVTLLWGDFLSAAISFLLIATVVFFLVVQPINKLITLTQRHGDTEEPTTRKCPYCFSEVQKAATRCPYCTSKLEAESSKAK